MAKPKVHTPATGLAPGMAQCRGPQLPTAPCTEPRGPFLRVPVQGAQTGSRIIGPSNRSFPGCSRGSVGLSPAEGPAGPGLSKRANGETEACRPGARRPPARPPPGRRGGAGCTLHRRGARCPRPRDPALHPVPSAPRRARPRGGSGSFFSFFFFAVKCSCPSGSPPRTPGKRGSGPPRDWTGHPAPAQCARAPKIK